MWRTIFAGLLLSSVLVVLPGSFGQAPKSSPAPDQVVPAKRDLKHLSVQQRQFYLSGQRALEWLERANKPDGRFVNGFLPALRQSMEGDSYTRQVGAAFALARAGKFYGDERAVAIARQALLTLLLETGADPKEPHIRLVAHHQANPVLGAGMLLAAIHELPAPGADLLEQADQLANMLRKQLRTDGSVATDEMGDAAEKHYVAQHCSGPALYGIIRSHAQRPEPWKTEALAKARAFYFGYWKENKNPIMLPWHSAAYAEAYLLTKDPAYVEAVFAMNDWLCGLQYQQALAGRAGWAGGFQPWVDGKAAALAPEIGSAAALASLAEGCRLARALGDVPHYQRYRQALEIGLQFLTTLQYSEANTRHFAEWYRPELLGGFHASGQDGNLRLDYAQHALSALVLYLRAVANLPE